MKRYIDIDICPKCVSNIVKVTVNFPSDLFFILLISV